MDKTILNVKTDRDVKAGAQDVARHLGLPLSTIVNAFLKEFIRERRIEFSLEPQLRPEIARLLKKASEDYKKKRNISPAFTTSNEMDTYLDS